MKLLNFTLFLFIIITEIDGQVDFPPCSAYDTLGKDTIHVLNSYSNSLYAGIDNEIEINRKNVPFKNIIVECTGGMVMEDDSNYIIMPARPGTATINIYQLDNKDTVLCFSKVMRVNRVPLPYITLDRVRLSEYEFVPRMLLEKIKHFEVHLSEDFVQDGDWYNVKCFDFGYPVGQLYFSKSYEGAELNDELLHTINMLPSTTEATFIFTIASTGDICKRLAPIKVKIH